MGEIRVPPIGPTNAKIVIVGESPDKREMLKGAPFVGPSGEELNKLLSAVGLRREDVYITHIVKYQPPSDRKDEFFFKDSIPTREYMDGIVELVGELTTLRSNKGANVVVPMGNYALWALTQQWGIHKWRGSIMESTLMKGLKVIPTIHPAWILRTQMWNRLPLLEWDFQRIAAQSKFPEIKLPYADIVVDPSPDEIEKAIKRFTCPDLPYITVDTEWYSPDDLAYIGFSDSPDYAFVIPATTMLAYRAYRKILGSPIPKVFQNAMFDDVALARIGIDVNNVVHDTMIAWHCCWTDIRDKKLSTICSVLTEWPYYKEDLEFVGKDDEKGQYYCGTACVVTQTAMEAMLREEFAITGAGRGYEISMSAYNIFSRASKLGIRADVDRIWELRKHHSMLADTLELWVSSEVGYTVNCRSSQQVAKLVYDDLGIKRDTRSTSQDNLMDIAATLSTNPKKAKVVELLKAIIKVRQNRKLVSSYLNMENTKKQRAIVDRDGRIRTIWNLAGTRSGRLSSTIPWWGGVAQQTVPDEVRDIFIADEGSIFIGWDLEQAEARVVAVKTRDYELLDDMENGIDIHVKLASMLPFGMTYDQLMEKIKSKGKDHCEERVLAKHTRHGMNYYLTHFGLKRRVNRDFINTGVGITTATARAIRERYLEISPGLEVWWEEVYQALRADRSLTNAFGRKRNFLGRFSKYEDLHREAISYYPQSTVGDLTTISIVELANAAPYAIPLTHMHDGGVIQVPEEMKDDAIEMVKRYMTREIYVDGEPLIIPVEVKCGYNLKDMKRVE